MKTGGEQTGAEPLLTPFIIRKTLPDFLCASPELLIRFWLIYQTNPALSMD